MTIELFYSFSQFIICGFAAALFFLVYYKIKPERGSDFGDEDRKDPVIFWFGLALATWSLLGVTMWVYCKYYHLGKDCLNAKGPLEYIRVAGSTINNFAFLMGTISLDYSPSFKFLRRIQKNNNLKYGLFLSLVLISLIIITVKNPYVGKPLDVLVSLFTLGLLGLGLKESFKNAELPNLIFVGWGAIVLTMIAQLPEIIEWPLLKEWRWPLVLTSKTALIFSFLALVLSYLWRRTKTSAHIIGYERRPDWSLRFTGIRKGNRWEALYKHQDRDDEEKAYTFPKERYRLFLKSAVRRVTSHREQGWLDIFHDGFYPKELERIVKKDIDPSKSTNMLFCADSSQYRLIIPPDKIEFDLKTLEKNEFDFLSEVLRPLQTTLRFPGKNKGEWEITVALRGKERTIPVSEDLQRFLIECVRHRQNGRGKYHAWFDSRNDVNPAVFEQLPSHIVDVLFERSCGTRSFYRFRLLPDEKDFSEEVKDYFEEYFLLIF